MPTIALVDDDRNILTSVGMTLEAEGYQVYKYTDGAAALQGLQDTPPDMMLAASPGCTITVSASGRQAAEAIAALEVLINGRFGED